MKYLTNEVAKASTRFGLKIDKSSSGCVERLSTRTKPGRLRAATISAPMTAGDVQPQSSLMLMAKSSGPRVRKRSAAPAQSKPCSRRDGTMCGSTRKPTTSAATPTGTLMRKIHCQSQFSTMTPPRNRPSVMPSDSER